MVKLYDDFWAGWAGADKRIRGQEQESALARAAKAFGAGQYGQAAADVFPYDMATATRLADTGRAADRENRIRSYGSTATTDPRKAASDAMAAGDTDAADFFSKYDDRQIEREISKGKAVAAHAAYVGSLPEASRRGAWIKGSPELLAYGVKPSDLQQEGADMSDSWLTAAAQQGMSYAERAKLAADQRKALLESQKTTAEIGKLGAETGKLRAETGKIRTESVKATQASDKAAKSFMQSLTSGGNVLRSIKQAKSLASGGWLGGGGETGFLGGMTQHVPGTKAYDLKAALNTIVANIGFDRLQQMREASTTGGALGAVTERELALLQSVVTSLDQAQSTAQFNTNLDRVEKQYVQSMKNIQAAYQQDFPGQLLPDLWGAGPGKWEEGGEENLEENLDELSDDDFLARRPR